MSITLKLDQQKKILALNKFLGNKDVETFNSLHTIEDKIDFLYSTLIQGTQKIVDKIDEIGIPEAKNYDDKITAILKRFDEPQKIVVTLKII